MSGSTSRLGLSYEQGTDLASAFPARHQADMGILDDAAVYKQGTFVARGAAGLKGKLYRATDDLSGGPNGTLYFDNGVSWEKVMLGADAEYAYSTWKPYSDWSYLAGHFGTLGTTFVLNPTGALGTSVVNNAGCDFGWAFSVNDGDIDAGSRSVAFRIAYSTAFSNDSPGTLAPILELRAVTSVAGTGAPSFISAVASPSGSVAFTPVATTWGGPHYSTPFTVTSAGVYVVTLSGTGTTAAAFYMTVKARLEYQQA